MIQALLDLLQGNEFFAGGLSLMLMGIAAAGARFLPGLLTQWVWRYFGIKVTVRDPMTVRWLGVWLAESKTGRRSRYLEAITSESPSNKEPTPAQEGFQVILRPGIGHHVIRHEGKRIILVHELEDGGMLGKVSTMTLHVLSRNRAVLESLVEEVARRANEARVGRTPIFANQRGGWWELVRLTPRRQAETVFLRGGLLAEVLADADWFFQSEDWYRKRGVPYRRGYLLFGEPGNGKSTLIQAIAAHCQTAVYSMSLTDEEETDMGIVKAMGSVPAHSLLILEDMEKIDFKRAKVTLSGLLNAIDGPLACEGRIFIATANDLSPVAPALLRPGRIDRRWEIGQPSLPAIRACLSRFGVDGAAVSISQEAMRDGWSMARLQSELMVRFGEEGKR